MAYSTKAIILKPDSKGLSRIHIRYTYNRKPHSISIEKKISPEWFDTVKGLVQTKYPGSNDINKSIREAQNELEDIASGLANPEFARVKEIYLKRTAERTEQKKKKRFIEKINYVLDTLDAQEIEEQIAYHQEKLAELIVRQKELSLKGYGVGSYEHNQLLKYLEEFPKVHTAKPVYQKQIKSFAIRFKKFIDKNNIVLSYKCFDYQFEIDFKKYLRSEHDASTNYIGSNIKKLKAFLAWVEDNKEVMLNKAYKKFKVDKEEIDVIYLTAEELELIWDYKKECKPEYVKYIDLCMFGNLTGLRYSDIKKSVFQVDNGLLKGRTKKTDGKFKIPLMLDERILGILKEYDFNLKLVSEQKYNKYIKEICKIVFEKHDINQQPIKILRKLYAEVEPKEEEFFKYELMASHSNRRGFCTRLWKEGYRERIILQMLGSKSTAILRGYVRSNDNDLLEDVSKNQRAKIEAAKQLLEAFSEKTTH